MKSDRKTEKKTQYFNLLSFYANMIRAIIISSQLNVYHLVHVMMMMICFVQIAFVTTNN